MIRMRPLHILIACLALSSIGAVAEDKGSCPTVPYSFAPNARAKPRTPPPSTTQTYAGSVMVSAEISDKGYVCSAQVIRGLHKNYDKVALAQVRNSHFLPARKVSGRAVPVFITVQVDFWLNKDGQVTPSMNSADPGHDPAKP